MFDVAAVRQWLGLYHDAPGLLNICATGDWAGGTFRTDDVHGAVAKVQDYEVQRREGIYARVTTLREPPPAGKRGGIDLTHALPALWADIDVAGPGHKADGPLPPDETAARALVGKSGLPTPTLWVASGGGFYPIWLLEKPHVVDGDLTDLADLAAGWQQVIGMAAAEAGWTYGTGVGDLARVLRIPGTVNRKAGLERPCRIVSATGTHYPLAVLSDALADTLGQLAPPAEPPPGRQAAIEGTQQLYLGGNLPTGDISPGDDYAAKTDWADLLLPHGWRLAYARGEVRYWVRPGKRTPGISATTNALGTDRLRVFSTDAAPFEATSYSKLGAFAQLEHGGSIAAAAKALHGAGYGTRPGEVQRQLVSELSGGRAPAQQDQKNRDSASGLVRTETIDLPAPDLDPELRYREEVAAEARRQRIRRDAKKHLADEEYEKAWREPAATLTLVQELELPDEPVQYRIDRLLPAGGNALLTAQYKAGKTTVCNNLVRSLADDEPFLGRFQVQAAQGRIALFNYEVGPDMYRRWLRDIGIANPERVCVLNVRGYRLPPTVPQVEAWIAKWLKDRDVAVWIVDPFARAFVGCGEENSNADVGLFLDTLDVIKERSGVSELVLPAHTGRAEQAAGQERSRGATRLDDWADARWLLTLDEQGRRYFKAAGRDVEVEEELLTHDPTTRRLAIGGWDRRGMAGRDLMDMVASYVTEHPGLGVNEIVEGLGKNRNRVCAALAAATGERRIVVDESGPGRRRLHYAPGAFTPPQATT